MPCKRDRFVLIQQFSVRLSLALYLRTATSSAQNMLAVRRQTEGDQ